MLRRTLRLLPFLAVLLLFAGCGTYKACPHGEEFVLRAVPQPGEPVTPLGMKAARNTISKRLGAIGIHASSVTTRGRYEVVIAFSGAHAPTALDRIVRLQGQLQVFDFEKGLAPPTVEKGFPTPYTTLYNLLRVVRAEAAKGTPQAYYLFGSTGKHPILQGPAPTRKLLLSPYRGKQPARSTILAVPAHRELVKGQGILEATPGTRPVGQPGDGPWYLFKLPPALGGSAFKKSAISWDTSSTDGLSEVKLGFTARGTKEFEALTKAEYGRGRLVAGLHGYAGKFKARYAQHNAIVIDDSLYAVPYIDYTNTSLSHGIRGGGAVISNIPTSKEASDLALVLRTGSLPYLFNWVSPYGSAVCSR
jgi:preprotein translocase subunit SecD